jgi:hypothetical protein
MNQKPSVVQIIKSVPQVLTSDNHFFLTKWSVYIPVGRLLCERKGVKLQSRECFHFSLLPNKSRGVPRVDDRRVISGIIHVIRRGLMWRDAPERYGPHKTL